MCFWGVSRRSSEDANHRWKSLSIQGRDHSCASHFLSRGRCCRKDDISKYENDPQCFSKQVALTPLSLFKRNDVLGGWITGLFKNVITIFASVWEEDIWIICLIRTSNWTLFEVSSTLMKSTRTSSISKRASYRLNQTLSNNKKNKIVYWTRKFWLISLIFFKFTYPSKWAHSLKFRSFFFIKKQWCGTCLCRKTVILGQNGEIVPRTRARQVVHWKQTHFHIACLK